MNEIRYTLLSDGPTDQALMPIIEWILRHNGLDLPLVQQWADPQRFPKNSRKLQDRIPWAIDIYPCDILFIHRDAEKETFEQRQIEIEEVVEKCKLSFSTVCVVPVRMTEAWLLFSELALRRASGNPNGKTPLYIPNISQVEEIPDPKEILYTQLRTASELSGRRLNRFNERYAANLVVSFIEDFFPLLGVPSFKSLNKDVRETLFNSGWITV